MSRFVVFCLLLASSSQAAPTHADASYGTHPAQMVDAYLAKSDSPMPTMIFIHGGGWRKGSKRNVPRYLRNAVEEGWLSVVSVEYRFTDVAVHPAQTHDCLRPVQFVRAEAKEWNIDPDRLGVTGGSAGGHLSMYVALHDDIADAESADPVARLSSRVSCALPFAGPSNWSLLRTIPHGHPAYRQLIGYEPGTPVAEMDKARMTSVSPISFVSADDPPIMVVHGDADVIVPYAHATTLMERLQAAAVEAELVTVKGGKHGIAGAGNRDTVARAIPFIRRHLKVASE
jgi:acetyl esterase/lipase